MKKYLLAWLLAGIPIQFWMLDNGARVYLMEVPNLPMVDFQLEFDAGSRRDGKGNSGLAQATAMMMSKGIQAQGNLAALDENQLGEAWADLGAIVGANATLDRMSLSLRSLTRPELLDADIWQTERERWIASLQESETKPSVLASRAFSQAVYAGHPYGAETSADSLRNIDTQMMTEFHARHFVPCRARISIVGAIGREQANDMVEQLLASLPSGSNCELLPLVEEV
ncbi:MAG: insulinase family protein, partial [Betaproteobacteria bacterium]|nr:insulinase family protein [Betaproteobacteria bacterium]